VPLRPPDQEPVHVDNAQRVYRRSTRRLATSSAVPGCTAARGRGPPSLAAQSGDGYLREVDMTVEMRHPVHFIPGEHLAAQLLDRDPDETGEWEASLDQVVDRLGPERARYVVLRLMERARARGVAVPAVRSTDYINSIPPAREPQFPGDEGLERRIRAYVRWNAAVMVSRANRPGLGVGGHIATYASAASLYEVGFNHFFRGRAHPGGGDQVFFQGHASPGIYARAYLEGRLSEQHLDAFRQESSEFGLPSYPHPRAMPDFWEFPTVSMGLGPIAAVYQARFNRYLHLRGLKDTSEQRVWCFLGDGEVDEPESLAALSIAAREELGNLVFVINCNLQRLDGPVRGNGKIVQELEGVFRGGGWHVVKCLWGKEWDPLFAQDVDGLLVQRLNDLTDGQQQTLKARGGAYLRESLFGGDARLSALVADVTDERLGRLRRGGHDHSKVYAAYDAAVRSEGRPTVVLAHTVKGWTLGEGFENRNAVHQMKKLDREALRVFRDRLELPVTDAALEAELPPYLHPGVASDEVSYLLERRRALGGPLPSRQVTRQSLPLPPDSAYAAVLKGSGKQGVATTMAFVRLLKELLRSDAIGGRIVPIVPDEARTFGMDSLFPTAKIYSPHGQRYEPVDAGLVLSYAESETGQMLNEGISEAGAMASFLAAGTSYATHGEPMIPVYLFYSMFGFQRTGDQMWQLADQMGRGFLIGATAGRTTLDGEGLQHQDGHSQLLASTNPACVSYDPAYGYELAWIVQDGLRRMYGPAPEDVFYYLTVYNEPYPQPAAPDDCREGVLRGMYLLSPAKDRVDATLLASGPLVRTALEAQAALLAQGVDVELRSVTSWTELRREAMTSDSCWLAQQLGTGDAPVVALSDWMRAVPDSIAPWVRRPWASLGTDGFGRSDTRTALRRHFGVDTSSVVEKVLRAVNSHE
jgi:pyruvate dehydrogenase E1 component